jgi:hypothetical protein
LMTKNHIWACSRRIPTTEFTRSEIPEQFRSRKRISNQFFVELNQRDYFTCAVYTCISNSLILDLWTSKKSRPKTQNKSIKIYIWLWQIRSLGCAHIMNPKGRVCTLLLTW